MTSAETHPHDRLWTTRLIGWASLVTVLALANFASRAGGGEPPADALYRYSTAVGGAFEYALLLGVVLLIVRGLPARSLLGLRRPNSWIQASLLAAAVVLAAYLAEEALSVVVDVGREQGLTPRGWQPERAAGYAANAAVIGLVGPAVEELLFRGLGFGLLRPLGRTLAMVTVGVAFGLSHGLIAGFPLLAALGIGLAYLREKTRSLAPAVLAHASFNLIALLAVVVG